MNSLWKVFFKINGGEETEILVSALSRDNAIMKATIVLTLTHKNDETEDYINSLVGVDIVLMLPK